MESSEYYRMYYVNDINSTISLGGLTSQFRLIAMDVAPTTDE
jgi:hypothetical protein